MNRKQTFVPRFILLMVLLALPVLACSSLSGGEEESETVGSVSATAPADSSADGESSLEEPAASDDDAANEEQQISPEENNSAPASGSADSDGDATSAGDAASEADNDPASSEGSDEAEAEEDSNDAEGSGTDQSDEDAEDSTSDPPAAGEGDSAPTGEGWGASSSGPQSACDHPYLPLRTGATWTYQDGPDTLIWEVISVEGDLSEATAVLNITVGDVSLDYHWSCAEGSGLASFDFANVGSAATGLEMTLEQEKAEGQFLLPADQLQPGATWETILESAFTFTQGEGDVLIEVTGDLTTIQTNEVLSTNPVTFDGETVEGVQIQQTDDISMVMVILENPVSQNMNIVIDKELGRGIGLVFQESQSDFGPSTVQLISYFIP